MEYDVIEFLEQSNFIEGVTDGIDQSVKAWKFIIKKDKVTLDDLFQTHRILMYKQPLKMKDRGVFRKHNVILSKKRLMWVTEEEVFYKTEKVRDVGVDWKEVPLQMEIWLKAFNNSLTDKYVDTDERKRGATVAMHISFEKIHPFADGNGRMGRILLNWQLQKYGLPIMIIREENRSEYYKWFTEGGFPDGKSK